MRIEFDEIYNQYVVWSINGSAMQEVFKSKSKKECSAFIRKQKKNRKRDSK
jgi:hypothetical protein